MAFRKPKKQPEFADLKGILAQSRDTDNALYQTVEILIERLTQFQSITVDRVDDIDNSVSNIDKVVINITANKKATYLTTKDETLNLPNSVQLLAGTGITFDDTVANKRTINSTGGGGGGGLGNHYDAPLTDGNVNEADLIFANGECIIVQVPV